MLILLILSVFAFGILTRSRFENLQQQIDVLKRAQGLLDPEPSDEERELLLSGSFVKITATGDTTFMIQERIDCTNFDQENERVNAAGKEPAQGRPL